MKRNRIQNIFEIVTTVLFCVSIIVVGAVFLFSPKKSKSELENRPLEKLPEFSFESLSKGTYTDSLTKYVSDNFVERENLVLLSHKLEDTRGIRVDDVKMYSLNTETQGKQVYIDEPLYKVKKSIFGLETGTIGEEVRAKIDFDSVVENFDVYANLKEEEIKGQQVGALFVVGDTALEMFFGNYDYCTDYASIVSSYKLAMPQGVKVYDMVVPTHFEFGLPEKYRDEVGTRQKPYIDHIYSSLDTSVITVDAYSEIKKTYEAGAYSYFRTDHHWTAIGAYSAYKAFANSAGFKATPLSSFEEKKVDKFLGTFYTSNHDPKLSENPDFVKYYKPLNSHTVTNYDQNGNVADTNGYVVANSIRGDHNGYLVFLGGDKPLMEISTDAGTGRSILVFKESYGNAFIPYLVGNFDKIYVADIRTFPFNAVDFAIEKNVTDVLFINNTITACSPPRIRNYLDLMEK